MISIIVPVYKVEKYVGKCIESILAQTYTDFELLLIDDGSPDSSGAICDQYAAIDPRIRLFHKENGGVSEARMVGVNNAKGDFISFVDSDDYLPIDALELLYNKFVDTGAEIVCGDYECVSTKGEILRYQKRGSYDLVNRDEFTTILLDDMLYNLWDKLFSRNLFFEDLIPVSKDIKIGEDFLLFIQLVSRANKVAKVNKSVYYYLQRDDSVMHTSDFLPIKGRIEFAEFLYQLSQNLPLSDRNHKRVNMMIIVVINNIMIHYGVKLRELPDLETIYTSLKRENNIFMIFKPSHSQV